MSSNPIETLMRVDGEGPAARPLPGARRAWVYEPGDATHYEVELLGLREARCVVGSRSDSDANGTHISLDGPKVTPINHPNQHTLDLCGYVCMIVLGLPAEEPEGLRVRRGWYADTDLGI